MNIKNALSFATQAGILIAILDWMGITLDWKQGLGSAAIAGLFLFFIVGFETWQELKQTRRPK